MGELAWLLNQQGVNRTIDEDKEIAEKENDFFPSLFTTGWERTALMLVSVATKDKTLQRRSGCSFEEWRTEFHHWSNVIHHNWGQQATFLECCDCINRKDVILPSRLSSTLVNPLDSQPEWLEEMGQMLPHFPSGGDYTVAYPMEEMGQTKYCTAWC